MTRRAAGFWGRQRKLRTESRLRCPSNNPSLLVSRQIFANPSKNHGGGGGAPPGQVPPGDFKPFRESKA